MLILQAIAQDELYLGIQPDYDVMEQALIENSEELLTNGGDHMLSEKAAKIFVIVDPA